MLQLKGEGGMGAIDLIIRRARRLHALGRIGQDDLNRFVGHLQQALADIARMTELDANGQEIE